TCALPIYYRTPSLVASGHHNPAEAQDDPELEGPGLAGLDSLEVARSEVPAADGHRHGAPANRRQHTVGEQLHGGRALGEHGHAILLDSAPVAVGGEGEVGEAVGQVQADLDLVEIPAADRDANETHLARRHNPSSLPRTLVTKPSGPSLATTPFTR